MRVFLAGATGFIGGHALKALSARGHEVTCLTRRNSSIEGCAQFIAGEWTAPASWLPAIAGHDAVVNCVGIIRESATATFTTVHETSAIALFEEAARNGVKKIVQISAMGADDSATTRFLLSKRAADRRLAGLGVDYVALRPSFVYGPGEHSMKLFALLAALPVTPVPGDGQFLVQPLHVEDLAQAITIALERSDLRTITVDIGGARILTFNELLDELAHRRRQSQARKLHIPWSVMKMVAAMTDLIGHGPINTEELTMLQRGSYTHDRAFITLFNFQPRPFTIS